MAAEDVDGSLRALTLGVLELQMVICVKKYYVKVI
jgi:hypothetical protein